MQTSFNYWRSAHPLVYIGIFLLIGSSLSIVYCKQAIPITYIFVYFISSLCLFFTLSILKFQSAFIGIIISIGIVGWGFAITQFQQLHSANAQIQIESSIISNCRNWVIEKVNKTILNKSPNGFALAILLGVKSEMDKSLLDAYKQLGILHIIAISGMHLEILFSNLKRFTRILPISLFFRILELLLLLSIVWLYTFMAFSSPSIVRASLLFSVFTIGSAIGRKSFIFNSMAISMCVLLIFNARGFQSIGLQLSYAAVIGIHLFYKPIYASLDLNNPIVRFLWSNGSMSISAMITTAPVLIYHFHQIASWVLVSNMIMIPLSNVLLYSLAILLALPLKYGIAGYWGAWIEKYINWLNDLVNYGFTKTHAGSIMIKMSIGQIVVYYIILFLMYLWLYYKKTGWLIGVFGIITGYYMIKLFS
jgi:competence protein ComEC